MGCTWIQRNEPKVYAMLHPEDALSGELTDDQKRTAAWMDMCDAIDLATPDQMRQITAFAMSLGVKQYDAEGSG